MTKTYKQSFLNIMLLTTIMVFNTISLSHADEKIVDILPPTTSASNSDEQEINSPTHPILRLTPDKSELIHLTQKASSIIVGNPLHINVIADSSTTLVIVPRAIGATYFTVLGKNGQVIMQRHVIVASPKKDYIRIKRVCADDAINCKDTSVFYCPNMCHEIRSPEKEESSNQNSASEGNSRESSTSNIAPAGTE